MPKTKKAAAKTTKATSTHKDKLRDLVAKMRDLKKAHAKKLKDEKAAAHKKGYTKGVTEGKKTSKVKPAKATAKKAKPAKAAKTTKATKAKVAKTKKAAPKKATKSASMNHGASTAKRRGRPKKSA